MCQERKKRTRFLIEGREEECVFDRVNTRRMCFIEEKNERSIDQGIHNTQPIGVDI